MPDWCPPHFRRALRRWASGSRRDRWHRRRKRYPRRTATEPAPQSRSSLFWIWTFEFSRTPWRSKRIRRGDSDKITVGTARNEPAAHVVGVVDPDRIDVLIIRRDACG